MTFIAPKTTEDENFPVLTFFHGSVRQRVAAFYAFVRQADDIADTPHLNKEEKVLYLNALEGKLDKKIQDKDDRSYARTLIKAFRWDANGVCIRTWSDLEAYCSLSAAPVGRFLLALHYEHPACIEAADALCAAHQILNHIQDYPSDMYLLNRCYFPEDLREKYSVTFDDLKNKSFSYPPIQNLVRECLRRVEDLISQADALPPVLQNLRLRLQATLTLFLARRLMEKLKIAIDASPSEQVSRVSLSRWDIAAGCVPTVLVARPRPLRWLAFKSRGLFGRIVAFVPGRLGKSLSTFYMFCRVVDDCADGSLSDDAKRATLARWKKFIANPVNVPCPVPYLACSLRDDLQEGALPQHELINIVDGCLMDIQPGVFVPNPQILDLYCRRVAGSVGCTVLFLLGFPLTNHVQEFAIAAGKALQYVNILRDVEKDRACGRVYLSRDVFSHPPEKELFSSQSADWDAAMARFKNKTEHAFDTVETLLANFTTHERKRMRLALLMISLYWRVFCVLSRRTPPGYGHTVRHILMKGHFRAKNTGSKDVNPATSERVIGKVH